MKIQSTQTLTRRFRIGTPTPTPVILLVMTAYPVVFTLARSFTDYNLLKILRQPVGFIALKNDTDLLTGRPSGTP